MKPRFGNSKLRLRESRGALRAAHWAMLLSSAAAWLCAAAPVAEGGPGSMAPKNVSSDPQTPLQKAIAASLAAIKAPTSATGTTADAKAPAPATRPAAASIQQQQANTRGENVSSDQQTPLQKAIAASLAAIKAPATASDRAAPVAAAVPAAAAAMSSSSAFPPSPAPRLPIPASARVAPVSARAAEGVVTVGVSEASGLAVEHIILGLLFVGMVFFIIDCCGPELSRMFGCRRSSRRWSPATKAGSAGT